MVALQTPEVDTGFYAPDFNLKATDGKNYNLSDVKGPNGLVVMFICNHCPFVKAILDNIIRDMNELRQHGIGAIAIMANNVSEYPEDSFANMKRLAEERSFPFPYVIDENQAVAKAYGAVCTPDFFGFNRELQLQYRGRLDESGMNNRPDARRELFEAMVLVSQTGRGPKQQVPSIGCSIKWK